LTVCDLEIGAIGSENVHKATDNVEKGGVRARPMKDAGSRRDFVKPKERY
jgi:hypothetical protein